MVNEKSKILKKVFSMVPLSQKNKTKKTHTQSCENYHLKKNKTSLFLQK